MNVENRAWVLFGLLLFVGTAAGVAWYGFASTRYATYEIRTADAVSGLIADSPVEFHGVEVGKVRRVRLVDPRSVSVLLSVRARCACHQGYRSDYHCARARNPRLYGLRLCCFGRQ